MNMTFTEKAKEQSRKINALINAAYDTGYYSATLEKVQLGKEERVMYGKLQTDAITRRNEAREALEIT